MLPIKNTTILLIISLIFIYGCSTKPKPIDFGTDNCDFCKMTISDNRYGAELVTKKGKVYKFDDLHCIKAFLDGGTLQTENIAGVYIIDFADPGTFIEADKSFLLKNDQLQSPMGSNIAAFNTPDSLTLYQSKYSGEEIKWNDFLDTQ